jgi:parallel beta-helix repeat protein
MARASGADMAFGARSYRAPRRSHTPIIVTVVVLVLVAIAAAAAVAFLPRGADDAAGAVAKAPDAAVAASGASEVGSATYPVPPGALFVAETGSDAAAGSEDAPLRSVQHAVTVATPGQTVVVRGGSYNQRTTITSDKPLTIQPYPGEAVWFDGSVAIAAGEWRAEGAVWVRDAWTTNFDTSPTYTRGAPDNTEENWSFLDPEFPLAAHPDQVWVGGVPQRQVAAGAEIVPGTFAVDTVGARLILGTDPTTAEVRASTKTKAFGIQSEGSVLRGVGIRGYATSVPGFGAVTVEAPGVTIEQVVIEENASTGLFVASTDATITDVTVRRNGMMGFGGSRADGLTITGLVSEGNNTEQFNNAPVSGGAKITLSREVVVRDSSFIDNLGPGLWFDQSNYDVDIVSSTMSRNDGHGLFLEISSTFLVAGNTISDNLTDGIKLNDTNHVEVWNNTITNNGRAMLIAQDDRRAADPGQRGRDPKRELDDPVMTWIIDDVTVSNNVFSGATGKCLICVEDYSREFTASEMGVDLTGNVYQRQAADAPGWFIVWSEGAGDPSIYADLAAFRTGTGEERSGIELRHGEASDAAWRGTAASAQVAGAARPIPLEVQEQLGWDSSVVWVGAAD